MSLLNMSARRNPTLFERVFSAPPALGFGGRKKRSHPWCMREAHRFFCLNPTFAIIPARENTQPHGSKFLRAIDTRNRGVHSRTAPQLGAHYVKHNFMRLSCLHPLDTLGLSRRLVFEEDNSQGRQNDRDGFISAVAGNRNRVHSPEIAVPASTI